LGENPPRLGVQRARRAHGDFTFAALAVTF